MKYVIETFGRDEKRKEKIFNELNATEWFSERLEKFGWLFDDKTELHFIKDMRNNTVYIREKENKFQKY